MRLSNRNRQTEAGGHLETIFVSIASYRDPECRWTVRDLFKKAVHTERIWVGICWQFQSPEDDWLFQPITRPGQVRCIGYDARDSLGPCWAKSEAQKLWQAESYLLSIDSHMRFAVAWDVSMIEMLKKCPSPKPILTTYPAPYRPPDKRSVCTPHIVAWEFQTDTGLLRLVGQNRHMDRPKRGAFLAGGFNFCSSSFIEEVPYDPHLYFYGEELSMSVRAWTWGWDVYSPHRCLIHHYYAPSNAPKHWRDHPQWWRLNQRSLDRVKRLLGITVHPQNPAFLESRFGLGEKRSIEDFEDFAGISFSSRVVTERARLGDFGPVERPSFV